MLSLLIVIWILGACLCVKARAMLCNMKTNWYDLLPALVFWPLAVVLICFQRHGIYYTMCTVTEIKYVL